MVCCQDRRLHPRIPHPLAAKLRPRTPVETSQTRKSLTRSTNPRPIFPQSDSHPATHRRLPILLRRLALQLKRQLLLPFTRRFPPILARTTMALSTEKRSLSRPMVATERKLAGIMMKLKETLIWYRSRQCRPPLLFRPFTGLKPNFSRSLSRLAAPPKTVAGLQKAAMPDSVPVFRPLGQQMVPHRDRRPLLRNHQLERYEIARNHRRSSP